MTKSTSGGCDQFETSPDAIEPELRTALCERRQTDRLKTNYSIDKQFVGITEYRKIYKVMCDNIYMGYSRGVQQCLHTIMSSRGSVGNFWWCRQNAIW